MDTRRGTPAVMVWMLVLLLALCCAVAPAVAPAFGSPSPPSSSSPVPTGAVGWRAPVTGGLLVVRPFVAPPAPWLAGHRGVDLAGPPDSLILAAGAGVVVFAGPVAGRGVVSIDHPGGLRTTYEPVLASVVAGERVAAGDPIGTLVAGHPGCPLDACLHWGLRRGAVYLDPMLLLRPLRLRLKPLGVRASGAVARLVGVRRPADPDDTG
jgi:murein DD-endopeptidase MepM/ murein hydrolase activator NlpD